MDMILTFGFIPYHAGRMNTKETSVHGMEIMKQMSWLNLRNFSFSYTVPVDDCMELFAENILLRVGLQTCHLVRIVRIQYGFLPFLR